MGMKIAGDDPEYDLADEDKDRLEKKLRQDSRELRRQRKSKDAQRKINRANEISRRKSKRAHKGVD